MYSLELNIFLMLLIGYLFGSIPVGYLYAKVHGVNIFEVGSGNPGSTNIGRVLGKKHGRIVFLLDILKTILPIFGMHLILIVINLIGKQTFYYSIINKDFNLNLIVLSAGVNLWDPFVIFTTGLGAILGHNFPFPVHFRGGKGIACTVAVVAYFNIVFAIILFIIHKLIGKFSGYVSLASILTLVIMFVAALLMALNKIYPFDFNYTYAVLPEIFIIMLLGIIRHKENIARLESGTENKIK